MLKGARQQRGDFVDGDLAGVFAGLGAAHAVAHGEGEIIFLQRGLAEFAEAMNLRARQTAGRERNPRCSCARGRRRVQPDHFKHEWLRRFDFVPLVSSCRFMWMTVWRIARENGGEFKINQTKASVGQTGR